MQKPLIASPSRSLPFLLLQPACRSSHGRPLPRPAPKAVACRSSHAMPVRQGFRSSTALPCADPAPVSVSAGGAARLTARAAHAPRPGDAPVVQEVLADVASPRLVRVDLGLLAHVPALPHPSLLPSLFVERGPHHGPNPPHGAHDHHRQRRGERHRRGTAAPARLRVQHVQLPQDLQQSWPRSCRGRSRCG